MVDGCLAGDLSQFPIAEQEPIVCVVRVLVCRLLQSISPQSLPYWQLSRSLSGSKHGESLCSDIVLCCELTCKQPAE